jgi:hypothetical protein
MTHSLEAELSSRTDGALPEEYVSGWAGPILEALARAQSIASRLMAEWGLTRYADLPPYPTMPQCGRAADPPVDFPLVVTRDDHEGLAWTCGVLFRALVPVSAPEIQWTRALSGKEAREALGVSQKRLDSMRKNGEILVDKKSRRRQSMRYDLSVFPESKRAKLV